MSKHIKKQRITTPAGIAKFINVNKPRLKYGSETDYGYDVSLVLDPDKPEVKAFKAQLTKMAEEARGPLAANAKTPKEKKAITEGKLHVPIEDELDKDGNETGMLVMKIKRDASWKNAKTGEVQNVTIPIFDAKLNKLTKTVGRGSTVKVAADVVPFAGFGRVGISLRMTGVQVLDLVEYDGADPSSLGFGVEDGFEDEGDAGAAPFEGETSKTAGAAESGEEEDF